MIEQFYRRVVIPGFESGLKRRKTFTYLSQLEESQWWSRERLEQAQLRRLQRLLRYCEERSDYYRQSWAPHGLTADSLTSLTDLSKWPIATRDSMRDYGHQIRINDPQLSVVAKSTGGSSGTPLQLCINLDANDRRGAAALRGYGWAGAHAGTRQTHLWGVPLHAATKWSLCKEHLYSRFLYRRDILNSFGLSDHTVTEYIDRINRFRPRVLVAYTNPLYSLAQAIEQGGYEVHRPHAIIVGAEKIHDFQRSLIERVFDAPVFETYGSREFTLIGAECEQHTGLHVSMENLIVEVVDDDGNPQPPGQEGQILITDLYNIAMPFIRYAIGDRGIAGFEQCKCGRGLPILQKVVGRQLDVIVTPDGRRLAGEFFPHLLKDFTAVRQFQVIQRRPDDLELTLVVSERWQGETKASLHTQIQSTIGESMRLRIREVDRIPLTPAGKLHVVRGLADPESEIPRAKGALQ